MLCFFVLIQRQRHAEAMTNVTNNIYFKQILILNILKRLKINSSVTQRNLAEKLNVSLGNINYYIKIFQKIG